MVYRLTNSDRVSLLAVVLLAIFRDQNLIYMPIGYPAMQHILASPPYTQKHHKISPRS